MQRDKNGNANNVVFYAILAHPSHMQFLLKSQNTKVTNTQLIISYSKTQCHTQASVLRERPKLYTILAFLSAVGLKNFS